MLNPEIEPVAELVAEREARALLERKNDAE
jgi:hypothetical protein